ncbi:hypothetical protein XcfCFBP6994P_23195 [Xanthomonas citri pv. phaseoli var. fuscans]|nr:hypothetical protein [Xanthomonas citri]QTF76557.1 hypothetical protein XcfCFBP6994P_23195 [Xanthomonas citri pv. phaseoli var. fuscans]
MRVGIDERARRGVIGLPTRLLERLDRREENEEVAHVTGEDMGGEHGRVDLRRRDGDETLSRHSRQIASAHHQRGVHHAVDRPMAREDRIARRAEGVDIARIRRQIGRRLAPCRQSCAARLDRLVGCAAAQPDHAGVMLTYQPFRERRTDAAGSTNDHVDPSAAIHGSRGRRQLARQADLAEPGAVSPGHAIAVGIGG